MLIAVAFALATPAQDPQDPPPAQPVIRLDPQVRSWLDRSPARDDDEAGRPIWDDGRVHGEVSVGVGTDGWRSWGGTLDAPTRGGRLTLQFRQSEGDRRPGDAWGDPGGYWRGELGADDQPIGWADRRPENGAAGQD